MREGGWLDKHPLTFVALSSARPLHNYGLHFRMRTRASGQRGIAAVEIPEMIKVGACQAQRTVAFEPQQLTVLEFVGAL